MIENHARPRMPSLLRQLNHQFLRFAAAGALGTACHYLVLLALSAGAGVAPGPAAACGALVGAVVNYWLNRSLIFRSERRHAEALPRFAAMALFGALLNGLIVGALARIGLHFMAAQVCATLLVLVLNYVISKKWIFPSQR
ncbi:GtrA family protein [Massilia sp. IC2-278]|uniref:GtrA family protein n=1 Tax=Massilia sp. IC2-278 TaxID=2887200 RepID=UPI001E370CA3|nr:GtrA family protein [Massilia sp. IC2-278]MCC2960453.1 GtrA family protein [Massilia sp. IC2-278]